MLLQHLKSKMIVSNTETFKFEEQRERSTEGLFMYIFFLQGVCYKKHNNIFIGFCHANSINL